MRLHRFADHQQPQKSPTPHKTRHNQQWSMPVREMGVTAHPPTTGLMDRSDLFPVVFIAPLSQAGLSPPIRCTLPKLRST